MDMLIDTTILGLQYAPLKEIVTEKGAVLHMLRRDSPLFHGFGEIYFSEIYEGAIKGWKLHSQQQQLFSVPFGEIDFVFFDERRNSPSYGKLVELRLGRPDAYFLLSVPAGIWYAFKGIGSHKSLLANCADIPHDPEEALTLPLESPHIPYTWSF